MESEEILRNLSDRNRFLYRLLAAEKLADEDNQSKSTLLGGYDASSGLSVVYDSSGSSFYSDSITTGAIATGEAVRLRRGAIPKMDNTPSRRKTKNIQKAIPVNPPIFIGFLIGVIPGPGDTLGQVPYRFDGEEFFLAIGYLQNKTFYIKNVISAQFSSSRRFQLIKSTPAFGYYSSGFSKNVFKYFYYGYHHLFGTDNLDPLGLEIYVNTLDTAKANPKTIKEGFQQISLTTTAINVNGEIYGATNLLQSEPNLGEVLKYLNKQGIIKYVAISACIYQGGAGGYRRSGVVVWELGSIDNIPLSVTNPACHFGFSWTYALEDNPSIVEPLICYGGYGAQGGIVLKIDTIRASPLAPPNTTKGYAFIPEEYLTGSEGVEIERDKLIIKTEPPEPLDTRSTVYTDIFKVDSSLPVGNKDYKIFFYFNAQTDAGSQVFK